MGETAASSSLATVKKVLSAHSAIGLVVSALLYIVCVTGAVSVLYPELQRLEQPNAPEMTSIAPGMVQKAVETVLAQERAAGVAPTTHLYVHLPVEDLPRTTITTDSGAVHIDRDGSIAMPEQIAWSDFLITLHYTLSLPSIWGLTLVGVLGVMLIALAMTGVVALPRIFRDAFRLKARSGSGVALADWHNRLSTWTLPFALALGFTGAAIGLGSIGAWTIAKVDYDGDTQAVFSSIFGEERAGRKSFTGMPDVAGPLSQMQSNYPDVLPTYAILHDPLQPGQHVQVVAEHSRRLIFGEYYEFDAEGNFRGTAGLADGDIGRQAAASNYKLHFGNFGGLPVKIAYLVFGAALSVVCATGMFIWLAKRRRKGHVEPALHAAWHGVVWGCPAMLLATAFARITLGNDAPFIAIFWIGLGLTITLSALWGMRNGLKPGPSAELDDATKSALKSRPL
jgi:uncharacterized iron-regulated membrane protein